MNKIKNTKKNLLWAIKDNCPYQCKYCYLKFDKDHNPFIKDNNKEEQASILKKVKEINTNFIFLAGAEPLLIPNIIETISELKNKGKKVVVCTNAIDIKNDILFQLLELNVDAISISLDSNTKEYNDKYRVEGSFNKIIKNIKFLIQNRNKTKVGIYSVLTKENYKDLEKITEYYLNELNIDYFIYQPVTLPLNHELYDELTISKNDVKFLKKQLKSIRIYKNKIYLPSKKYNKLMIKGILRKKLRKCFIKNNFLFLMPDGIVCKCSCFIFKGITKKFLNEKNQNFKRYKCCDCFSEECSNIYQLINFDEVMKYGR